MIHVILRFLVYTIFFFKFRHVSIETEIEIVMCKGTTVSDMRIASITQEKWCRPGQKRN